MTSPSKEDARLLLEEIERDPRLSLPNEASVAWLRRVLELEDDLAIALERVRVLDSRLEAAKKVVEALAESEPVGIPEFSRATILTAYCQFCGATARCPFNADDHRPDCPVTVAKIIVTALGEETSDD